MSEIIGVLLFIIFIAVIWSGIQWLFTTPVGLTIIGISILFIIAYTKYKKKKGRQEINDPQDSSDSDFNINDSNQPNTNPTVKTTETPDEQNTDPMIQTTEFTDKVEENPSLISYDTILSLVEDVKRPLYDYDEPNCKTYASQPKPYTLTKKRKALKNFVVIDTETTGLSVTNDKVIQLSALKYINDKLVDTYNQFINPGTLPLSDEIANLTGIKTKDLENKPSFDQIKDNFLNFVGELPWVGHNIVNYDIPILVNNGLNKNHFDTADTLSLSKSVLPNLKNHKLVTLKHFYGIENQSHNALSDCQTNAIVYQRLRDRKLNPESYPQTLTGLRFSITGQFAEIERSELILIIKEHGGKYTQSVSHLTNYLIKGKQVANNLTDGIHSRNELKAEEYNINTIDFQDFMKLINKSPRTSLEEK